MRKFFALVFLGYTFLAWSQIGLTVNDAGATEGYTLFHPNSSTNTFLIDNEGNLVFEWPGTHFPGTSVSLLDNGNLLRTGRIPHHFNMGGVGGYLEMVNSAGQIVWSYEFLSDTEQSHHDFAVLPNGNILLLLIVEITEDEAIAAGRDPESVDGSLWSEKIIEFTMVGIDQIEIVWEWSLWDHVVQEFDNTKENYGLIAQHPGKLNLNYYRDNLNLTDWIHLNSIEYNEVLDQIVVGSPFINEIWIIDHSTTTEEARTSEGGDSGKGGDFLYRWGNPQAYDQGTADDRRFFGQHNPQWQYKNGGYQLLLFNNGEGRSEEYSSIDLIELPYDPDSKSYLMDDAGRFLPENETVIYQSEIRTDFFSRIVSGVEELANGNYFICEGFYGRFFEINSNQEIIWEYISPHNNDGLQCADLTDEIMGNITFRAQKITPDFPGLPEVLVNKGKLEQLGCPLGEGEISEMVVFPNPFTSKIYLEGKKSGNVEIVNLQGQVMYQSEVYSTAVDAASWQAGLYLMKIQLEDGTVTYHKLVKR